MERKQSRMCLSFASKNSLSLGLKALGWTENRINHDNSPKKHKMTKKQKNKIT
jgi:hypothetical protein